MRSIILFIGGLVSGYVVANLKYKDFNDIIEEISGKVQVWLDVTKEFVGSTAKGLEGFDSDQIQMNIEAFINQLSKSAETLVLFETTEDKLAFIEDEITKVTAKLMKSTGK